MSTTVIASYGEAVRGEIKAWMGRRGMNQRRVCEALDVQPSWLSRRLNGTTALEVEDLARLAQVLDCSVTDLLPDTNTRRDEQPTLIAA